MRSLNAPAGIQSVEISHKHLPCPVWWPSWQHLTPFGSDIQGCNTIPWQLRGGQNCLVHMSACTNRHFRLFSQTGGGVSRVGDSLEVPEHVSSTEQHGCGVGNVPSYSLGKWVACTLKEKTDSGLSISPVRVEQSIVMLCQYCSAPLAFHTISCKQRNQNKSSEQLAGQTDVKQARQWKRSVDTHSLKHSILCTVAFPRNNSCSSNQPCGQVIDDVTIEVGHDQHVKLVWVLDQLQPRNRNNTWNE